MSMLDPHTADVIRSFIQGFGLGGSVTLAVYLLALVLSVIL